MAAYGTKGNRSQCPGVKETERTCGPRWTEKPVHSKGCGWWSHAGDGFEG